MIITYKLIYMSEMHERLEGKREFGTTETLTLIQV